ncbi:MAG: tRNA pseudouridine(38-40) synthase TruA [Phycisphaerae bacterium]|nr:tRNA pseudouridine(38-40) synthase TruA [Phycisphaerae bacterium]
MPVSGFQYNVTAMMRNLMLVLAYDGTDFHGWQFQPEVRTVQECVEKALRRVVRHQVVVVGCSRTDAGVHAAGYVANFYTTAPARDIQIFRSVGSRLPKDMTLVHLAEVPLTFHATRSAVSKMYRYRLHNAPGRPCEQMSQRHVYHIWQPLDIEAMRDAAEPWVGTHDFTSFASAGSVRETNVRTIHRIEHHRFGEEIRIDIEGSGFLYKQVRNMVGTLCEIGRGHWPAEHAGQILEARSRQAAGPTAPARGLCLQWVKYDIPNLPRPSPALLERAEQAEPPAGAARANVDMQNRSAAPMPPGLELDEEPPA